MDSFLVNQGDVLIRDGPVCGVVVAEQQCQSSSSRAWLLGSLSPSCREPRGRVQGGPVMTVEQGGSGFLSSSATSATWFADHGDMQAKLVA